MKSYVFPCEIEEELRLVASEPIPYMRTASFGEMVKSIEADLLKLAGCEGGKTIIYTASGTGAMDAVVSNYVTTKKKAFVIVGGSFGRRWSELCDYYGVSHADFPVEFARDIDYDALERAVMTERPDVMLTHHHETSTGQLFDMERIGAICRKYDVSLVTDAISSFLSDSVDMKAMGIDMMITSSQKGLNISPGLSIVFIAPRLRDYNWAHRSYYFDFSTNLHNLTRGQTPYSPATTIFMQLRRRLDMLMAEGGADANIRKVRERALKFRSLCDRYGWKRPAETPSNCLTGFFVERNGDILAPELIKRGYYIMPGGTPNYFRVAHLGEQPDHELEALAAAISEVENLKRP